MISIILDELEKNESQNMSVVLIKKAIVRTQRRGKNIYIYKFKASYNAAVRWRTERTVDLWCCGSDIALSVASNECTCCILHFASLTISLSFYLDDTRETSYISMKSQTSIFFFFIPPKAYISSLRNDSKRKMEKLKKNQSNKQTVPVFFEFVFITDQQLHLVFLQKKINYSQCA